MMAHGMVGKAVFETMADGRVENREVNTVEERVRSMIDVAFSMLLKLRGMAE